MDKPLIYKDSNEFMEDDDRMKYIFMQNIYYYY